jgi:peptidoglycan/xylan/chitin deacetylase (PgdA/CDA1 family)
VLLARKHPDQLREILAANPPPPATELLISRCALFPARWFVLGLVALGFDGAAAERWFLKVRRLEYWKGVRRAGGFAGRRPVRVLCYHSISEVGEGALRDYGVRPSDFRRQIRLLEMTGFRFIGASDFLRYLRAEDEPTTRTVLLTFDDCYQDLVDAALPILEERRIPAVAFAVSGLVGLTNAWDEDVGAPSLRLAGAEGLRRLQAAGVVIGSHSRTHTLLTRAWGQRLADEVAGSVADLEELGLRGPLLLAYPHGESDEAVERMAAEAGYRAAFTVTPGLVHPGDNPFRIARLEVLRGDAGWRFLWKVALAGRPFGAFLLSLLLPEGAARESRPSMPAPVLQRLHPSETSAGADFNVQPNGFSALAVDCENAAPGCAIVFDGRPLVTHYGDATLLTAIVPKELYANPGRAAVRVKNGASISNTLVFEIR